MLACNRDGCAFCVQGSPTIAKPSNPGHPFSHREPALGPSIEIPARKPTAHPDDKVREVLQQASSAAGRVGWQIRVGSGRQGRAWASTQHVTWYYRYEVGAPVSSFPFADFRPEDLARRSLGRLGLCRALASKSYGHAMYATTLCLWHTVYSYKRIRGCWIWVAPKAFAWRAFAWTSDQPQETESTSAGSLIYVRVLHIQHARGRDTVCFASDQSSLAWCVFVVGSEDRSSDPRSDGPFACCKSAEVRRLVRCLLLAKPR